VTPSTQDSIEYACTRLFIDYARHVDFGSYDRFVDLFTKDASLDVGFALQGREQIARSMTKRPDELRARHLLSNISIDIDSPDHASGIAYLTLYRHLGPESLAPEPVPLRGVAAVGHYANEFRLTQAGWRIASCKLHFAFRDPAHFPTSR